VLQPNFRGSTGYGRQYVEKGNGQWGRGMQDDIDDGVKWLVARGVVDPKRVCIMGASFGAMRPNGRRSETPTSIAARSALPACRTSPRN